MDDLNCRGCVATMDGQRYERMPGHPRADKNGWVEKCIILREEGLCKLVLAKRFVDMRDRQCISA